MRSLSHRRLRADPWPMMRNDSTARAVSLRPLTYARPIDFNAPTFQPSKKSTAQTFQLSNKHTPRKPSPSTFAAWGIPSPSACSTLQRLLFDAIYPPGSPYGRVCAKESLRDRKCSDARRRQGDPVPIATCASPYSGKAADAFCDLRASRVARTRCQRAGARSACFPSASPEAKTTAQSKANASDNRDHASTASRI